MTNSNALDSVYARAAGVCECIGGGCPALTHRPGVNRCYGTLGTREATIFFTVARFADQTDPNNIEAICGACAASPRKNAVRVFVAPAAATGPGDDPSAA